MLEKHKQAILFYKNNPNYSIRKVAEIFHMDRIQLGKLLKEQGILEDRRRKYFCDFDYFKNIDCEEKAYWLGFILADGCVKHNNNFCFTLSYKDSYILNELNNCLNSTYPITVFNISTNYIENATYCNLTIRSKLFCDILKSYGIIENKTFQAKFNFENKIPPQFLNAYIRGIFDGDGWFTNSTHTKSKAKEIGFSGTKDVCNGIQKTLKEFLNIDAKVTPCQNIYRLRIGKTNDIIKLYKFMYKNANYYLKRKYNLLKDFAALNETTM